MAVACVCWWWLVLAVVLVANAPGAIRLFLCVLLPLSLPSLFRFVLLLGPRAVRVIEWNGQGEFRLGLRSGRRLLAARLAGHQRLGLGLWTLEFLTAEGRFRLLVDSGLQSRRQVRRLGRALRRGDLIPSRPKV